MNDPITLLRRSGQSIWLDDLSRRMVRDGTLATAIRRDGVTGVTSNPAILARAVAADATYAGAFERIGEPHDALQSLAVDDVRHAADLLRPTWRRSGGHDGWVSIEVDPRIADDAGATVDAAIALADRVDRRNALIKIPGTRAGVEAIERVTAAGVPVNVTLLFSLERHRAVAESYLRGLDRLLARGGDPRTVASVASFFVSRIDAAVDARLSELGREDLRGRAAIASAKLAYQTYRSVFSGPRWERLVLSGATPQRPLWASTSVKDPSYRDVRYVEELIGPATITTVPRATLTAFQRHGRVAATLEQDLSQAWQTLDDLSSAGVDLAQVADDLERDGVERFVAAQESALAAVASPAVGSALAQV
jgi:transaldolase